MRLGLVTLCALRGQRDRNIEKILSFAKDAADQGCQLVLFPEYSVHGPWVTYDPESDLADLREQSEPIPGPSTDRLTSAARDLGLALGVGLAERGLSRKPFNTYAIITGDGVAHVQRKLQPTESEMAYYRGGGDALETFELQGRSFGVTICADNESPEIHDRLRARGAEVIIEPHYDCTKTFQNPGDSWEEILEFNRVGTLRLRAEDLSRRLGVIALYIDAKDPRDGFAERPEWVHYVNGKSAAFGSDGSLLAENAGNQESLLVVEV